MTEISFSIFVVVFCRFSFSDMFYFVSQFLKPNLQFKFFRKQFVPFWKETNMVKPGDNVVALHGQKEECPGLVLGIW